MLVLLNSTYEELSREAARIVAGAVSGRPTVTLGLATGSTTLGMYKELVRLHREQGLDFSRVVTFNLDEYLGLAAEHPQSFHCFMRENFFAKVNVAPRMSGRFARRVGLICRFWGSGGTGTSDLTSRLRVLGQGRG